MSPKYLSRLFLVPLLVLLTSLSQGSSPAELGVSLFNAGSDCVEGEACMGLWWPKNPARPMLLHDRARPSAGSSETTSTFIGEADSWTVSWRVGDKEVAVSRVAALEKDGFKVSMIDTVTKQAVTKPTGSLAKPHFAAPAIRPPRAMNRALSFEEVRFAWPSDKPLHSMGPTVLYNADNQVMVISSLDHFISSIQAPVDDEWWVGFQGEIEEVPAGTSLSALVVTGSGINATMQKWGEIVRAKYGRSPTDLYADVVVSRLGYWTDNGAYYYYNLEPGMNAHQTLMAVKNDADKRGIPYGYFQLDSWWYPKASDDPVVIHMDSRGGVLEWEPKPELFPEGIAAFRKELGLPLILHNRYYDKKTPYCEKYKCVYGTGPKQAALPIEPAFWNEIMELTVSYGAVVYEQDWLYTQYEMIPWLRQGIGNSEQWFDMMANAAREHDLTLQICMASPGFFMQQVKHPHITHIRTADDYRAFLAKEELWPDFFKTSMFAWALGMLPYKDNFHSVGGQAKDGGEKRPFEEALISTLSAGPVGPSDKAGLTDVALVMKTCRKDGLLLKPDRPATLHDLSYLDPQRPLIITTESAHKIGVSVYLAAFNLDPAKQTNTRVKLEDLPLSGDHIVYNYRTRSIDKKPKSIEFGAMEKDAGYYYVICPLLENGMALIGEADKFATLSQKRFEKAELVGGALMLELAGVPGERSRILVYTGAKPAITGEDVKGISYSVFDGLLEFTVVFPESGRARVAIE